MRDTGPATEPAARGRLSFADLLRGDVGKIHRAMNDAESTSRGAALLFSLGTWSEKHGTYRAKIVYCPPLNLLWGARVRDDSNAAALHACYAREIWRERGPFARLRLVLAILWLWLPINLGMTVWFTTLNGGAVRQRSGKGVFRQAIEQLWLSALHGIMPPWYYMFDLHDDALRAKAGRYLHRYEYKGVFYRLIKSALSADRSPLADKIAFDALCRERGLQVVPLLAVVEKGGIVRHSGASPLPPHDLFAKPRTGRGGQGAERWDCLEPGRYRNSRGAILGEAALLDHFKSRAAKDAILVQRRMQNHPDLLDLSNGALSTLRIATFRDEQGGIEVTNAVFRMAIGDNDVVDNFHAGGIAAAVDLDTGELGRATDLGLRPEIGWRDRHPDTDAQIRGRRLPYWSETLELVRRAHAAFADRIVVGWDVAILQNGPCLIEANGSPDVDIFQRIEARPLGDRRFAALLHYHLRRAQAARDAAAAV